MIPAFEPVAVLVGKAPVPDQKHQRLQEERERVREQENKKTPQITECRCFSYLKGLLKDLIHGETTILGEQLQGERGGGDAHNGKLTVKLKSVAHD